MGAQEAVPGDWLTHRGLDGERSHLMGAKLGTIAEHEPDGDGLAVADQVHIYLDLGSPLESRTGSSQTEVSGIWQGNGNGFAEQEDIVSASGDETLGVWSAVTDEREQTLEGHSDKVSVTELAVEGQGDVEVSVGQCWSLPEISTLIQ